MEIVNTSKAMVIQAYYGENIGFRFSPLPRDLNVQVIPKMIFLSKKDLGVKIARPYISFIVHTVLCEGRLKFRNGDITL